MRVLMIVNELLHTCGVSSHTYHLLNGLKTKDNIDIYLLCGGGNALEKFQNLNVPLIVNDDFRHESRTLKGYIKAVKFLYKIVKEKEIDIIHSHHHYSASIAQKISHFTKVKTVMTNHGILPEIGVLNHFPAKNIIAVNEHVIDYLKDENNKSAVRIRLIRYGLPLKNVERICDDKKLKVLAASRLVLEKDLKTYVQAIKLLPKSSREKTEFYIAGEGNNRINLEILNEELKTSIVFLGRVENLSNHLNEFDIFVMTSASSSEGFPMTIIEAGMNKNLVITSNFRGSSGVFEDRIDGLVYEVGQPQDLVNKLDIAINNFQNMKEYINNFHMKVRNLFDIETMTEKTIKYYYDIADK